MSVIAYQIEKLVAQSITVKTTLRSDRPWSAIFFRNRLWVERFQNLKFVIRRGANIHSNVLSLSKETTASYLPINPIQAGGGSLGTPQRFLSITLKALEIIL